MTSVQSVFSQIVRPTTKFHAFITPTYTNPFSNSGADEIPIPFTVVNQVLDINVNENAAIAAFVADGGFFNQDIDENRLFNNPEMQGKLMGGAATVNALGPNMTTFLRKRIEIAEVLGSPYAGPLNIYIRPLMTRVQSVPLTQRPAFENDNVYGISTEAPTSTGYIGGDPTNNYLSFYIFKTPLTVQFVSASGDFKYLTLTSQISED